MMIKFSKFIDDIQAALLSFCMEQDESVKRGYISEDEAANLVESAFKVIDKMSFAEMDIVPIYNYFIYSERKDSDEILPDEMNSVLFKRAIRLGSFMTEGYFPNNESGSVIYRGYDVVYDVDSETIKLIYCVHTSDCDLTTVYRTVADNFEDFDLYEFVIDITSQIIYTLNKNFESFRGDV